MKEVLDSMIAFDGHNDFNGTGGKQTSIPKLARLVKSGVPIDLDAVEDYLLRRHEDRQGVRSPGAARQAREWITQLQNGHRFRGERGEYLNERLEPHRCRLV